MVFGGKARFDTVIIDVHARHRQLRRALNHLTAAAPGQEARIILDAIDEFEHLLGAALDEHGFFNDGHDYQWAKMSAILTEPYLPHPSRIPPP